MRISLIDLRFIKCKMCFKTLKMFFVLFYCLAFQSTAAETVHDKLLDYEAHVNMSLLIERQDKERMTTWNEEFQVRMVDVTAEHRVQVTNHQEHSFRKHEDNDKWTHCLNLYQNETTKAEQLYYVSENKCLKEASSVEEGKREAITQVGKEIRKWRKSYRYLKYRCRREHPRDKEKVGICLVNYMEKDNYSETFKRLISMRLEAVQDLHNTMKKSLEDLGICLDTQFAMYLELIRRVMIVLDRCYRDFLR